MKVVGSVERHTACHSSDWSLEADVMFTLNSVRELSNWTMQMGGRGRGEQGEV